MMVLVLDLKNDSAQPNGMGAERAAIVAWLRHESERGADGGWAHAYANAIERQEHYGGIRTCQCGRKFWSIRWPASCQQCNGYECGVTVRSVCEAGELRPRTASAAMNLPMRRWLDAGAMGDAPMHSVTVAEIRRATDRELLRVKDLGTKALRELRDVLGPHDPHRPEVSNG